MVTGAVRISFAVLLGCTVCGCGGNDKHQPHDAGAIRDAATTADAAVRKDAGSDAAIASDEEGQPCQSANDCHSGLSCVASPLVDQQGNSIGICARGCSTAIDCQNMEQCISYTGLGQDAHCANVVTEEFGPCGATETSICGGDLQCLIPLNAAAGHCVKTCSLNTAVEADAGTEEDGGADVTMPPGAPDCSASQMCIDDGLDPQLHLGVCGTLTARGQECGSAHGLFCGPSDFCGPENPADANSTLRCFQDCSNGQKCDQGACTLVAGLYAICM